MGRQWRPLAAAVVALALAGGGAAYLLTRPDDSPAPATKQAIAAVAVDVLGIEPTSYEPNPSWDVPEPLGVVVRWHPGGSHDAHYLHVAVEPSDPENTRCHDVESCTTWETADGTMYLRWQEEVPEEDPGIVYLAYRVDGEDRIAVYAGQQIHGDPREQDDLPVGVDDLERVVTDERFSATTTQEMVDTDLAKWPEDEARAGEAVPTTPAVIAQWMREDGMSRPRSMVPADTSGYGDRAVGTEFRSPGLATSVVLVAAEAKPAAACGPGWHCTTKRGVTQGWRPGVVRTWRASRDVVVVSTVRSAALEHGCPPYGSGRAATDCHTAVRGYASYGLTTTRQFAEDAEPLRG